MMCCSCCFCFFVPFLNQAQSVSTVLTLFGLYGFIFKCANCVLLQLKLFIHHNDLASFIFPAMTPVAVEMKTMQQLAFFKM